MVTRQNVIPRKNVIPGAQVESYHVGTVNHCGPGPLFLTTVLTAADLQDIGSMAVDLLPDPRTGQKWAILGIYYHKAAGAYTSGSTLGIHNTDTGSTVIGTIAVASIRASGVRTGWAVRASQSGTPANFAVPDGGVDVNGTSDFAGAGGDLALTVWYIEVD